MDLSRSGGHSSKALMGLSSWLGYLSINTLPNANKYTVQVAPHIRLLKNGRISIIHQLGSPALALSWQFLRVDKMTIDDKFMPIANAVREIMKMESADKFYPIKESFYL